MKQVFVNGAPTSFQPGESLADLLLRLGVPAERCATAINGVFIARAQRQQALLNHHDQVMTFEPITGG